MWYEYKYDNSHQKTKMTHSLIATDHHTSFNNEQSPYGHAMTSIESYFISSGCFRSHQYASSI